MPRSAWESLPDVEVDAPSLTEDSWPNPQPLPTDLAEVPSFDLGLLPVSFAPLVSDVAERMQCPPDFVALPLMVSAGSVIGSKIGIRPRSFDTWTEYPNVWGMIVGRPGVMKSPAVSEALRPLRQLEAHAREIFEIEEEQYKGEQFVAKVKHDAAIALAKKRATRGEALSADDYITDEPDAPICRRYTANDTSLESLGELLRQNPNGILVERDEIASLLTDLSREERAGMRAFLLTGADGRGSYTFDRIGRGLNLHVPRVCLSLFGTTQPGRISSFLRNTLHGGDLDDGLMQRFGLLAWPDMSHGWRNVDRWPDTEGRRRAFDVFARLDSMTPEHAEAENEEDAAFLRFSPDALEAFVEWRAEHEALLRSGTLHPALESHYAKYRKTIPALALIGHLADGGAGPVTLAATVRALDWSEYLKAHAIRFYGSTVSAEAGAARRIVERIRSGDLQDGFRARDIKQRGWSGLTDGATVSRALDMLTDYDWIAARHSDRTSVGGRPTVSYVINPNAENPNG